MRRSIRSGGVSNGQNHEHPRLFGKGFAPTRKENAADSAPPEADGSAIGLSSRGG